MRLKYQIKDKIRDFKYKCQRAKQGYADVDVWNINTWFLSNIIPMLQKLRDEHYGYPGTKDVPTDEKWCEILDRMIFCFKESLEDEPCAVVNPYREEYDKIIDDYVNNKKDLLEDFVNHSWEHDDEYWKYEKKVWKYKHKMLHEALDLFTKYFDNLWD